MHLDYLVFRENYPLENLAFVPCKYLENNAAVLIISHGNICSQSLSAGSLV
jgi:hypothetical protein